jgi:hypothetical protein
MKRTTVLLGSLAFYSAIIAGADAAPISVTFSGSTTAALTDATNYFGLGTTIGAGQNFSFVATYDDTLGQAGGTGGICGSGCNFSIRETLSASDPAATGAGPSHITGIDLTLNGTTLAFDTSGLTSFSARTFVNSFSDSPRFPGDCPSGSQVLCFRSQESNSQQASITNGVAANGSSITFSIGQSLVTNIIRATAAGPNPVFPTSGLGTFTTATLTGSIALVLLANDGSTLVNLAGQNAFGLASNGTEVPLPAALPLLLAGLAGLAGAGRAKRRKESAQI